MTISQVIVETVKAEYPKFSKPALSLATRSYETGVTFTPRARELKEAAERATTPHKRGRVHRVKSIHFSCRLAPTLAGVVKNEMERLGVTQQELLEGLLLRWVEESRSPAGTEERQRDGNSEASTSKNITHD